MTNHLKPTQRPTARFRPDQEAQRLQTLLDLNVLDGSREAFSNAVAAAAASIAQTPISAISLVAADRLWFKATCGLSATEIARDVGFCAHTVLGHAPLVIEDLRLDDRFARNPLVVGSPYAVFYAGFPLRVGAQAVGALCVVDDRPRRLTATETAGLVRLADGVASWLATRAERVS